MAAAVDPTQLPEGYTLEADPTQLPEGYTLESAPSVGSAESAGMPVLNSPAEARSFAAEVPAAIERAPAHLPFADRATAALGTLTGAGDFNTNLAKVRAYNQQQWQQHPGQEMASDLLSAATPILGMVGKAAKAVGPIRAMFRGALGGGAYNAAQGVSNIPDLTKPTPEDVTNVALDTAIGTGVGGALPLAGFGVGGLTRKFGAPRVPGVSAAAQGLFENAIGSNAQPIIQKMGELGSQAMPLDASEGLKNIASGVANSEDLASREALRNTLEARNVGGDARLQQSLDKNFGPNIDSDIAQEVIRTQRKVLGAAPFNAAKAAQADNIPVDTTNILANLGGKITDSAGNPQMQAVLGKARSLLMDPVKSPMGEVIGTQPVTDPVRLHNTKEYLGNVFNGEDATIGVKGPQVNQADGAAKKLYGELNEALRGGVPGYADANDKLSSLHRQEEQIVAGKTQVLSGSPETATSPTSHGLAFNALPQVEQGSQKIGLRDLLQANLGVKGNDLSAFNQILQGPGGYNTGKFANAFGAQPTQNVVNTGVGEAAMRGNRNEIVKGSQTGDRLAMVQALKNAAPSQNPSIPYFAPGASYKNIPAVLGNAMIDSLRAPASNAQYYSDLARGVSRQGPEGQAFVQAMGNAYNQRLKNQAIAEALKRGTMFGLGMTAEDIRAGGRRDQQ